MPHDDLNHLLDSEPELENMGTTFTGIFITPDVWYAAHIGDSRIYLFRPAEKKLWHTWDHSLVGELMRTHEITVEGGRFHPMSNRIAKALIAQKDGKPVNASIVKLDNLQAGDVLLLCSDGVIESWGDLEFVKLFSDTSLTFEQKCEKLRAQCDANSKDNNTAIVAEIEAQDAFNYGNDDELDWTTFADVEADYNKYMKENSDEEETKPEPKPEPKPEIKPEPEPQPKPMPKPACAPKHKCRRCKMVIIIIAMVALVFACYFFIYNEEQAEETNNMPALNIEHKEVAPAVENTDETVVLEGVETEENAENAAEETSGEENSDKTE